MLGEILLDKQWISQDILTAALRLQALIWDEKIDVRKATDVLREAHRLAGTPDSADVDGLIADSGNKNVSLYEFLRITGYLTKDKIRASLKRVMDEPRLLALVMNHAKETDSSNNNYLEDATKLALRDAATLRFVMSETFPRDRGLVDSALVFHQLVQEGKLTLCQALVNYSIKINGIESDTAI